MAPRIPQTRSAATSVLPAAVATVAELVVEVLPDVANFCLNDSHLLPPFVLLLLEQPSAFLDGSGLLKPCDLPDLLNDRVVRCLPAAAPQCCQRALSVGQWLRCWRWFELPAARSPQCLPVAAPQSGQHDQSVGQWRLCLPAAEWRWRQELLLFGLADRWNCSFCFFIQ